MGERGSFLDSWACLVSELSGIGTVSFSLGFEEGLPVHPNIMSFIDGLCM